MFLFLRHTYLLTFPQGCDKIQFVRFLTISRRFFLWINFQRNGRHILHRLALIMPEAKFPSGMTVSQLSTLGYLSIMRDGEDVYQRDIETFFKLRRSTVSSLLNTLERKGLLRREPVPHDARLKKLVLTEAGLAISGQARSVMQKMNQVLIQGLSPEEVTQFSELLGKVEYALSSSNC